MSARTTFIALAAAAAATSVASLGASSASASSACSASHLAAKMVVLQGSAGAGNIEYRLVLRNVSHTACTVSGHPALRLRAAGGANLPTHVMGVPLGVTAVLVSLKPGAIATTTLRFSPDVPGPGEQTAGPCEKTAHSVRVSLSSPGSGSLVGPIQPPTAVCEHGSMSETNLNHG
jgi:hypothetical protein